MAALGHQQRQLHVVLGEVRQRGRPVGGFWRLLQHELCDLFCGRGEGEAFAGSVVELVGDGVQVVDGDGGEVEAFGEVLA